MRNLLWIVTISLLSFSAPAALNAVIEVNESPYYSQNKNDFYGGASLTDFYAPLPVFFEGWKSTPRESIAEYTWDFGDGSPWMPGFNAAHVYEEPGVYTATLAVTDGNGNVDTDTVTITVRERTGTTYYVDSETGSDSFNGTSPSTAWRTATHAFHGADRSVERYGPGDQVLFRRGQSFDMTAKVDFGHTKQYGFMFGAFGEGSRPIIRNTGTYGGDFMFKGPGNGLAHVSFVDLDFRLRNNSNGDLTSFWLSAGEINQLMFLRCLLFEFNSGFIFSGDGTLRGAFLFHVTAAYSASTQLFVNGSRVGIRDSYFDLAGTHIAYIPRLDRGVIYGNTFSRPAFGRHALRVSGGNFTDPSNNFYIANNYIRGWIDPVAGQSPHGNGTRYNHTVTHLGPNTASEQSMEWATFENNTVVDGEMLLTIGSYENLTVRNNLFYTGSRSNLPRILFSSHHGFDRRPLKNITVRDNYILNANLVNDGNQARVFEVREYSGPSYQGSNLHENLSILDNHVIVRDGMILKMATGRQAQLNQIKSNRQRINTSVPSSTYEYNNNRHNLPGWRDFYGQDLHTTISGLNVLPETPLCSAPQEVDEGPTTVSYTGAFDNSGTGLKEVVLWYRHGFGSWIRSDLTSTGASGSFEFQPVLGSGVYYFWAQAEDNAGNRSAPPLVPATWSADPDILTLSRFGDTSTFHGGGDGDGNGGGSDWVDPCKGNLLLDPGLEAGNIAEFWGFMASGSLFDMLYHPEDGTWPVAGGEFALRFYARETDDVLSVGQRVHWEAGRKYLLAFDLLVTAGHTAGAVAVVVDGEWHDYLDMSEMPFTGAYERVEVIVSPMDSEGMAGVSIENPFLDGGDILLDNFCLTPVEEVPVEINAVHVQMTINGALGLEVPGWFNPDINGDGRVDAADVQLMINATLGYAINAG